MHDIQPFYIHTHNIHPHTNTPANNTNSLFVMMIKPIIITYSTHPISFTKFRIETQNTKVTITILTNQHLSLYPSHLTTQHLRNLSPHWYYPQTLTKKYASKVHQHTCIHHHSWNTIITYSHSLHIRAGHPQQSEHVDKKWSLPIVSRWVHHDKQHKVNKNDKATRSKKSFGKR